MPPATNIFIVYQRKGYGDIENHSYGVFEKDIGEIFESIANKLEELKLDLDEVKAIIF